MTPQDRAFKADQIINNEVFIDAFVLLKQKYIDEFCNCKEANAKHLEYLWIKVRLLEEIKTVLIKAVETGRVEQKKKILNIFSK